ncbi:MAG: hypothetical protein QOJ37_1472 [Pseudonocardiales bacterium]|nr:hypothetical protein [Pseudonocardiales bacterium]
MMHQPTRRQLAVLLVLTLLAVLLASAIGTGRVAFVATRGVSMNPLYHQGDLVLVAKADSYHVGQIVAYRLPSNNAVVLHRITGTNAAGFVMKGDNNQSIDPLHPTASQLIGRAALHIPQAGLWLNRLISTPALALIACALAAGGGGTAIQTRRRRKRAAMSRHANRSPRGRLRFALPELRTAIGTAAGIAVLGLALGALAWNVAPDRLAPTSTQTTRQMSFSYDAAVRRSAAYDSTAARSPDPVFRRLTDTVELHLAYQGSPGSVSVAAELSTPGGWHSRVPLAAATSFTENRYESTVRLDLKAFDARAQSAAAVTGLPAAPVNVAIVPIVKTTGQLPFTPTLNLTLTPLQLVLAGEPTSLHVQDATTVNGTTSVARTLHLLGGHLRVIQARALSAALLVAAVLAGGVLSLMLRRGAPLSEGAAIRRRYAPLLAPVHRISAPSNSPIVDVAEFASLAKLAERCGQLVLHWSRSAIDTFIVLDEGTTYRYRVASDGGGGAGGEGEAAASVAANDRDEHPDLVSLSPSAQIRDDRVKNQPDPTTARPTLNA